MKTDSALKDLLEVAKERRVTYMTDYKRLSAEAPSSESGVVRDDPSASARASGAGQRGDRWSSKRDVGRGRSGP